jgi:leader peptidase (prepilin peptidase)/N-methyltransferase
LNFNAIAEMQVTFDEFIPQGVEVTETGRWFVVGTLLVLGGVLGSFMNVVVYRLPRRMSLSRPASHCPHCEHPIRWHDNVPILGWIMLGGRCRDCRAPIAVRYPLVEALMALTSAALALVDVAEPLAVGPGAEPMYLIDFVPYTLHMTLVCTLLCAALIEFDGWLAPQRLLAFVIVLGMGLTIAFPELQSAAAAEQWILRGVPESIPGLFAALWLSVLAWPAWVRRSDAHSVVVGASAAGELVMVGVYLGLWAVVAVGVASMVGLAIAAVVGRPWPPATRWRWSGWLYVTTMLWLVTDSSMAPYRVRWTLEHDYAVLIASGAAVAVLAVLVRSLDRTRGAAQEHTEDVRWRA